MASASVAVQTPDSLDFVRESVAELRDLELEKASLEARLEQLTKQINHLAFVALVDVMNEKRVPKLRLAAEGNMPAFEAELAPFYKANIAANWSEDRRHEAFEALERFGADDLIKTTVAFSFPRGAKAEAMRLVAENRALMPKLAESVHSMTLTAWLREQIEAGRPTPPLDVLGAHVGQRVTIKRIA